MNTNHMDARAVAQPGGLYASANNGILEALMAYFQHKDRERQGARQLAQDEREGRVRQLAQALQAAERYGAGPSAERSGWMNPDDQALVEAAKAAWQRNQEAQADRLELAQHEAELQRYRTLTEIASKLDERRRGVAKSLLDGTATLADATAAGISEEDAVQLFAEGDRRRKAAESEARAKAERDAAREQRAIELHKRLMERPLSGAPKAAKGDGQPKKAPTSQADLDRIFQNSQRAKQGLPPLPEPAKPGGPSLGQQWGDLSDLLQQGMAEGWLDAPAGGAADGEGLEDQRNLAPPEVPEDADSEEAELRRLMDDPPPTPAPRPARPGPLGRGSKLFAAHRQHLDDWIAREGAAIAGGVQAAASARRPV